MRLHPWSTVLEMTSTTRPIINRTSSKQLTMLEVRKVIKNRKAMESKADKSPRHISPVTTWLLDEAIDKFLNEFSKGYELEILSIQDTRQCSHT
jgi:hypothetical protein